MTWTKLACLAALAACNLPYPTLVGTDAAGGDAAPAGPPATPLLRGPRMGETTGSVHADVSLRPTFAWRAAVGATSYEIAIDDSCETSSFTTCLFPSPEIDQTGVASTSFTPPADLAVSLAQPVGRRYFWRVRACDDAGCSAWSDVWYLDVGRLADDVNGDGYGDLLVSIVPDTSSTTKSGAAYVVFGRSGTASPTMTKLVENGQPAGTFYAAGAAIVGDVDGDGYADIVVGAEKEVEGAKTGVAYLYLGRATWPASVDTETTRISIQPSDPDQSFGGEVAGRGDINGDGYGDFVISSIPGASAGAATVPGYVRAYFGKATWSSELGASDLLVSDPSGLAVDEFGFFVTLADVNEDGHSDLLIGAPGSSSQLGALTMYFGQRSFPSDPYAPTSADVTMNGAGGAMGTFGISATGCTLPDGPTSVAVGAPFATQPQSYEGIAFLYEPSNAWPKSVDNADGTIVDPRDSPKDLFASAVHCGDVTGDRADDLVIGAPTADDVGALYLYPRAANLPVTLQTTLSSGLAQGDQLGNTLAVTDFDGDGVDDIFAGAPSAASEAGDVFGWFGRQSWPSTISSPDITIGDPSGVSDERFGSTLD